MTTTKCWVVAETIFMKNEMMIKRVYKRGERKTRYYRITGMCLYKAHNNSGISSSSYIYLQFTTLLMPRGDVKTFLSFMNEILFPFMFFFSSCNITDISHVHTRTHSNDDNNNNGYTFI